MEKRDCHRVESELETKRVKDEVPKRLRNNTHGYPRMSRQWYVCLVSPTTGLVIPRPRLLTYEENEQGPGSSLVKNSGIVIG